MHFVTYNIQYGLGRDGAYDLDRIAAAVDGADVIALQEVERFWPRSGMVDQPAELAKRLPEYWWVYGANVDVHSPAGFPGEESGRRRQFGNMLLARRPVLSSRNVPLPRSASGPMTMQRGALEGLIEGASGAVRVYCTHLCYRSAPTRFQQLQAIIEHDGATVAEGGSWSGEHPASAAGWVVGDEPMVPSSMLVMGDLNFGPVSEEYWWLLERRNGSSPTLRDAWVAAGNDVFTGSTHAAGRIDYCLVSRCLEGRVRSAWVDAAASGSDHQPVWFEIDV